MKYLPSIALIFVNIGLVAWFVQHHAIDAAIAFLSTLAAVAVSAVVERMRFGRRPSTLATRLEFLNVLIVMAVWDAVMIACSHLGNTV